jgi:hypothetical protein
MLVQRWAVVMVQGTYINLPINIWLHFSFFVGLEKLRGNNIANMQQMVFVVKGVAIYT